MRKYIDAEAIQHSMKLQQLGAKVHQINSKMCYVQFDLGKIKLEYAYNINNKGKYFLERIKPYPLPLKVFESEIDIVETIKLDLSQFKNAIQSKNIENFVEINQMLHNSIKKFEDLFLYYNVPTLDMKEMREMIEKVDGLIELMKDDSVRICFDKEPDNL
jgi:ribosomal protein S6